MPTITLTELAIRALATVAQTDFWDLSTPGFGMRVGPRSKTYVLKHENRRQTIGRWPHMTLKEARDEARKRIALVHTPLSKLSFKDAAEKYVDLYCKRHNKARTHIETARLLSHVPFKGKLDDVTSHDIKKYLNDLPPGTANHTFAALRSMYNWCQKQNYTDQNPVQKLSKPHKTESRERVLTDAELKTIWCACPNSNFGKIVKLLMLTGQRRGEIAALQFGWITGDTITFPKHITKNNTEHTVPLGQNAQGLLSEAMSMYAGAGSIALTQNNTLLFPSHVSGGIINGWNKLKAQLDKASGITGWTLHDLRRTFSTIHARIRTPIDIQEALLNHRSGSRSPIQRIYDRFDRQEPMRAAMAAYEEEITRILEKEYA